jgi:hypothetical protein
MVSYPQAQDHATVRDERLASLRSLGIPRVKLVRVLRRHGLDQGRLGWIPEDVWRVKLRDILRQRKSKVEARK